MVAQVRPFIGSFAAILLSALLAVAQFAALYAALTVFIGLNLLQFVIGSQIEPCGGCGLPLPFHGAVYCVLLGHSRSLLACRP